MLYSLFVRLPLYRVVMDANCENSVDLRGDLSRRVQTSDGHPCDIEAGVATPCWDTMSLRAILHEWHGNAKRTSKTSPLNALIN